MKRYILSSTTYDIEWDDIRTKLRRMSRGRQNPLKSSSFGLTDVGYDIEQILMDVEDRRHMIPHSEENIVKFYDSKNPEGVFAEVSRDDYYDDVLNLILRSTTQDSFETKYSKYLWDLIPY